MTQSTSYQYIVYDDIIQIIYNKILQDYHFQSDIFGRWIQYDENVRTGWS